jgi:hypothetical protein
MISPRVVLDAAAFGALVPAAVTLAVAGLWLWRGWRAAEDGGALAAAAGLAAGWAALAASRQIDWEFLTPADAWDWLLPLALVALAAGVAERRLAPPAQWALRLAVAAAAAWRLVSAQPAASPVSAGWYAGLGVGVLALWGALDPAARRWPGVWLPAMLTAAVGGAAAILEFSGNLKFAQLAGVLAAVLAGCAALAWWRPSVALVRGAVPALAVMLPGLLFEGFVNNYGEVPAASFLLALATPLFLGAAAWLPAGGRLGRWRPALRVAALVPILVGVALAVATYFR